jgi:hypothetical protein
MHNFLGEKNVFARNLIRRHTRRKVNAFPMNVV